MNLLRTILVYLAVLFTASVQTTADTDLLLLSTQPTAAPTAEVTIIATPTQEPTAVPEETAPTATEPAQAVTSGYRLLKVGSSGENVLALQQKLTEYGYEVGSCDGRYGNNTRRAVENFQRKNGLSADGIAGKQTQGLLFEGLDIICADGSHITVPAPSPTPEATNTPSPTPKTTDTPSPTPKATNTSSPTPKATNTPSPTPKATNTPSPTPKVTNTPTPAPKATNMPTKDGDSEPTDASTAAPKMSAQSLAIFVNDAQTPILAEDGTPCKVYTFEDELYLPILQILKEAGISVISDASLDGNTFAFAIGNDIISFSYTENKDGSLADFQVFRKQVPQIVQNRDIRLIDNTLYFPAGTLQNMTGTEITQNEADGTVRISFSK